MKKKILSVILAIVMVFSFGVNSASAFLVKPIIQEHNYGDLIQYLEVEELYDYAINYKNKYPNIDDDELNDVIKHEIEKQAMQMGLIVNPDNNLISPNSYADLPVVRDRLNEKEKIVFNENLFKGLGVLTAASRAMYAYTQYYTPYAGGDGDNSDAFRHGLWMALSTYNSGADYAERFGRAHEEGTYNNPAISRAMDLNNNSVGVQIGRQYINYPNDIVESFIESAVDTAVKNGRFARHKGMYIGVLNYLVTTNSEGARYWLKITIKV